MSGLFGLVSMVFVWCEWLGRIECLHGVIASL